MADIDSILAGVGGNTRADFSGIGTLADSYWGGKDQRAKNDLRDAFKPTAENPNGVPMKDGQIDIPTIAKTLFQKGDVAGGTALLGQAASAGERAAYSGVGAPQPFISPSVNGQVPISGNAPVRAAPAGTAQQEQPTIMKILAAQGIPNDQLGAASASVARQMGIDPTAPLDLQDPQVRNVLAPAVAQIKKMGLGQVQPPQPGDIPPQQAPQPQVAQAPQGAPHGFQPSPAQVAAQNDPKLKRLQFFAASPDKATAESARAELKAYIESQAPTSPMKEAGASGLTLQQYQERQGEQAAQQAGASELAKTQVGEQQAIIAQGRQAGVRLGTANLMTNIIQNDKNLNLGFGSETTLKIKMALERVGIDTGDLSGAQLLQKYNSILAAESTKGVTSRGTNFDMRTFMANNPGLGMDEKGNIRMLGILSQNAKREYELGKLVPKNRENWDNWDNVVEAYDKRNPVKDPTTGKILSSNSIIAPGPNKGATPASGSAQAAPAAFPNAKQAPDGNWYVPDPARPGKYSKVVQ